MKKTIIIGFSSILLLSIISTVTLAQNNAGNNNSTPTNDAVIDTAKEQKENAPRDPNEKDVFKCKTSSSKMDALEGKYYQKFNKHQETHRNIIGRVTEVLDDLEEGGYDVTSARGELVAFQAQVEALQNDYDSFSNEFQQARDLLCEDDVSGYRESLKQSRNQLKVLRTNMLKLRSEYQNNLKPELLALREQIRDRSNEQSPSDVPIQKEN